MLMNITGLRSKLNGVFFPPFIHLMQNCTHSFARPISIQQKMASFIGYMQHRVDHERRFECLE